jgi:hypothetical protein
MEAKLLPDGIPMRGDIDIYVRDARTQEVLRHIGIRNKITFLAANVLVELLAQRASDPDPDTNKVFSMRMGTSNTAASRADTNLGAFAVGKELADVNKLDGVAGELQFVTTLGAGDGNGVTLQEAGLFTQGSAGSPTPSDAPGTGPGDVRMVARQVHVAIPKTAAITIEYSWRLAFTA